MHRLIDFTIRNRGLILFAALLLVVVGILALVQLPFDAFPDTTPVMVQVNVAAEGWAPVEIERQMTYPIERELAGLSGLTEVRSVTKYGLAQVTLLFEDDVDLYLARQQTSERLISIDLPEGVPAPELGPISTGLGEVFHYIVLSRSDDPTHARTVQDWIIKPQMQSIPGVAEVNSWGGFERQYQVVVDPYRLTRYGISLSDVVDVLQENIGNVSGGQMVRGGEQVLVRGIGIVTNVRQIEEIVVATREDTPIHIHDVADVAIGHKIRRGAATYDGTGEVVLGLGFILVGENPGEVTEDLAERLEEIQQTLPEGVETFPVYQRTNMVAEVLHTVQANLIFGALLVIAILFIFLGNLRAGLIVASAIPLSMLFAFDMMSRLGIAGSLMSLGAIDFGLAVDNAVIQVENTVRRLSESDGQRSVFDVIHSAIMEVRKPTLFGELIIIIVYLPVLTLQGVEGKLFRPMAITVVLVVLGSLILSFSVIPALVSTFLGRGIREYNPRWLDALRNGYRVVLDRALKHARLVITGALILVIGGLLLFTRLGAEFVPRLSEGSIVINLVRLAGVSLDESVAHGTQVEQIIIDAFPDEVEHVWTRTGTAELATDPMGLEVSDVFMTLHPRSQWTKAESQAELVSQIDAELSDLPGMNRIFTQPIEMRINEMIAGIRSDVGIKIFGDDLRELERLAEHVATLTESVEGAADVSIEQLTGQPELELSLDRDRLARYGLSAREVLDHIESLGGLHVGEVFEGQKRFDLALWFDEDYRGSPEDISRITLPSRTGPIVSLDQVTLPLSSSGPATITREWSKRRIVVQSNVRGRDVGTFVDELQERITNEINMPAGYFVRYGGQFENLERARMRLAIVVPIALTLIFALLYWTYRSFRDALLIFTGVPLAVVGGIATLALRGMPFSISAGVGFVALSGIAVLNGLVLVSAIKRRLHQGDVLHQAVRESAVERLRPVLMTALVMSFGFIPMAISTGVGAEVQRPLASVVVGGILSSMLLTLFVLPSLYKTFGAKTTAEK
ncbi:MAG: CusA/CzcA family heavy metal efflux RND transporter [candidate division Zixibacteria bacterium]|nr:CusA/CzcA family heavy metal efflux RND transporter [candidate division Zixibacteria bacterium]